MIPQPPPPARYTLERAVQAALDTSAAVRIARRAAQVDARRADQSAASRKPGVAAAAVATRYDQATRVAFGGGAPPVEVLPEHSEILSLTATQRLDLFGQLRATVDQARLQGVADRLAADSVVRQRRLQATLGYIGLLKARDQVRVAASALDAAQAQRKQARDLFDGGIGQKVDLLRAETQLAQAEQTLEAARNAEAIARAAFDDLVGLPLDTPVELDPLTDAAEANPDVDAAEKAAARRDDVLEAEAQIRAAELGVTIARNADRPGVALQAVGSYFPTTSFQFPRQRTVGVSLSVSIPLADGGLTRARTDEARLRLESARNARDMALGAARLEIRQAFLNLRTADRQRATARFAAEQARAARDLAQVRYAGQVGLFLELSDAQAALVRAEVAAVDAVHEYLAARARYESAAATEERNTNG